jgi:hypothetical protein
LAFATDNQRNKRRKDAGTKANVLQAFLARSLPLSYLCASSQSIFCAVIPKLEYY